MKNPFGNHNFKNPKIVELAFVANLFFDNLHRYRDSLFISDLVDVNDMNLIIGESYSYKKYIAADSMYIGNEEIIYFYEFSNLEKKPIKFLENIGLDSNPEIKKILRKIKDIKRYILKKGMYLPASSFNFLESSLLEKFVELDKKIEEIKREMKLTHTKKVRYML